MSRDPEAVPPPLTSITSRPGEPIKQKKAEKGLEKALLGLDVQPDDAKLREMFPLPEGMDVGLLRSRLGGKKAKGNFYLTSGEMEGLTQRWALYRSLGVYYM
ncbi:hypothetical protein HD553DRAFT_342630 [Filobasidium floriforme]|uniref:uncharacterized protein n=1 Tax=Filobasidium floriforme TaxID=5210 RepID=UPI001E8D95DA|nr:uncharacterized protein HD553DRAFT_342630 [Filobasidium floriforme]KAH8084229.1 hypothetical protein HD553DRAFT_342630 [Filobasidium floriforme]